MLDCPEISESWVLHGRSQPVRLRDCRPRHKSFVSGRPRGAWSCDVGKSILLAVAPSGSVKSAQEEWNIYLMLRIIQWHRHLHQVAPTAMLNHCIVPTPPFVLYKMAVSLMLNAANISCSNQCRTKVWCRVCSRVRRVISTDGDSCAHQCRHFPSSGPAFIPQNPSHSVLERLQTWISSSNALSLC